MLKAQDDRYSSNVQDDPDLVPLSEAAILVGTSPSAISNAAAEGRLPFTLVYGRRLYARADLEAYKQRTQGMSGKKAHGRPRKT